MGLQELIVQEINDFGGIEQVTAALKRLRKFVSEKRRLDNLVIYYNLLYTQKQDIESDFLHYYRDIFETKDFLLEFNKNREDETITFMIYLIDFQVDYLSKIRRIS